ncbi:MAG: sigma-70 family RNA polymerase sigma factor [Lachnospiraceae bacterium]|nr:sigma-70 family RNA polymerase sigma factor [Lachnospiraceae bacterium]MBQ8634485.1 sigma-70 family RNA polymerase sigma factor [Lachnospiraceae bacterium]
MEDKRIIQLLFARAENAVSELAARFGKQLQRIAYNILGNPLDAEECTNDTYLALWNAIPPVSPDPLAPYVYRTGRNTALKRLHRDTAKKRDSRYDVSLEELNECLPGESLEQTMDARELGRAMDRFLDTKSKESRYIFVRRYWFGDSVTDIAKELKLQENAVYVRLNRIRTGLKEYLKKEGYHYEA